ncbi:hypothetical protein JA1_003641 [Spathaspora sp. JA1]|nr:hypothetical protein JA1_003641 [Spathaspora sp. JA1]
MDRTTNTNKNPIVDWIRLFGIVIPFQVTRSWLYFTTSASTTFFILLPLSILTYNQYYNTLIPNPSSPVIPLNFTTADREYIYNSNYISPQFPDFEFDLELTYVFNIQLELLCPAHSVNDTLYKLHYNFSDEVGVFNQGTFILDCNPLVVYSGHNNYVPYSLTTWVSPILSSLSRTSPVTLSNYELRGRDLVKITNFTLTLDQNWSYLIDDNESFVRFDVKWTGFRYYLVKYYYTCYMLGTFIFFSISSAVSILSSYALLLYTNKEHISR